MFVSNSAICENKKKKKKELRGILSKLKIGTPLSNIPLTGDLLLSGTCFNNISNN